MDLGLDRGVDILSGEIWTYDSPGIVKMTGDFRTTYFVGMKVRFVQNSTPKYFVIASVEYVGGETKLTLDGGGLYTVTAEAITAHMATTWISPNGGFPLADPHYIVHSLATAENEFLVSSAPGAFVTKTLAEVRGLLGSSIIAGTGGINAFQVVLVAPPGEGIPADGTNETHAGLVVGLALDDITEGEQGFVQTSGEIRNPAWDLDPGETYYLAVAGAISKTPPEHGFWQRIGVAKDSETLIIMLSEPIVVM